MKMHIDHVQAELQRAGLHVSRRDLMRLAMAGGAAAALGAPFMTRREALAQEEPVVGGVWRMALTANPTAYPITAPGAIVDILVNKTMYNNLVKYQLTEGVIEVVPDLAESWEANADLTQYTFTLRSDVTWHDGEPLTADDVKFTFDSVLDPEVTARFSGPISSVESVEVVDPQTVVFNLKSSFAPLPVMLGYNQAIVPKHLLEGQDLNQPTEFLAAPVGSGPFKFGTAQQGSYLEVVANEDYFLGRPNLDRIIFQVITDGNARVAFTGVAAAGAGHVGEVDSLRLVEALVLLHQQRRDLDDRLAPAGHGDLVEAGGLLGPAGGGQCGEGGDQVAAGEIHGEGSFRKHGCREAGASAPGRRWPGTRTCPARRSAPARRTSAAP